MSTTIQIISDIHLEQYKNLDETPIINKYADMLVICGNLGNPFTKIYWDFITIQSKTFDKVFIVLGNRDYYSRRYSIDQIIQHIRNLCNKYNNVIFLEKNVYDLNDRVSIIGCTLWSYIDEYSFDKVIDSKNILTTPKYTKFSNTNDINLNPNYINKNIFNQYHSIDVDFLSSKIKELQELNKKVIVITHFIPSYLLTFRHNNYEPIDTAYCCNLDYLINEPIITWVFGHIENNTDMLINNIRCVSNVYGFDTQKTGYKEKVVIEF